MSLIKITLSEEVKQHTSSEPLVLTVYREETNGAYPIQMKSVNIIKPDVLYKAGILGFSVNTILNISTIKKTGYVESHYFCFGIAQHGLYNPDVQKDDKNIYNFFNDMSHNDKEEYLKDINDIIVYYDYNDQSNGFIIFKDRMHSSFEMVTKPPGEKRNYTNHVMYNKLRETILRNAEARKEEGEDPSGMKKTRAIRNEVDYLYNQLENQIK